MPIFTPFDFGYESKTTDLENASIAILFAPEGPSFELGLSAGALAVADGARYAEFYEMVGDFSPMDRGVHSEIVGGTDPPKHLVHRALELMNRSIVPIVVSDLSPAGFPPDSIAVETISADANLDNHGIHNSPVHLRVYFDAFKYRSGFQSKGHTWYELLDAMESVVMGPGVVSTELLGIHTLQPKTPPAQYAAQILIKLIGFIDRSRPK